MKKTSIVVYKKFFFEFSILLMAISMPFWMFLNNISIGIALIATLVLVKPKKLIKNFITNKISISFFILYIIMILSLLYTENLSYGYKVLGRCSMFVLIPIIFAGVKEFINQRLFGLILKCYIIATALACLLCLSFAVIKTIEYGAVNPFDKSNGNFFSYFNLTAVLKTHPIYFGVNVVFSLSVLLHELVSSKSILNLSKKSLLIFISFFIIFIPLLNSFILLVSSFIIFSITIYNFFIRKRLQKTYLKVMGFVILLMIPVYFSTYFIAEKFKGIDLIEDITTRDYSGDKFTAIRARNAKIKSSIDLIKDHPLIGVGIGDGTHELIKYYSKNKFEHGVKRGYNSHNQFLTTFIYTGIFGFSILFFIFIFAFTFAIKKKNFYLLFFLIVSVLFFLTESVLERQKGIFIFLFFVSLLPLYESHLLEPKNKTK
ncbi:O-antigen ligase family protein [Flavobacterium microcysteis]|uniref:O-antigen ligase-related domain-containing protein n=1 Tax=Flavobacterium microcysteis TaxID=2596891 RepID=A0A501QGD0_9FLAO|nr:O-antigen ligase family protein [Flavobacterium microcysteis]TPD71959.1 hypothetical protein FJA49_03495 [Flavobacterium microcysteis]